METDNNRPDSSTIGVCAGFFFLVTMIWGGVAATCNHYNDPLLVPTIIMIVSFTISVLLMVYHKKLRKIERQES